MYPGHQQHHHQHHHQQHHAPPAFPTPSPGPGGFAPAGGPPPPGARSPYPPPPGPPSGYPPPSGYAPPPGPPPSGYGSPSPYPPPQGPPLISNSYPGPTAYQGNYPPPNGPPPMPPATPQYYGPQFQQGGGAPPQQPFFQYSQCNGRKKGLCIGINYFGQQSELNGCINDARNVERFLCQQFGYKPDDIVVLVDDARDPRSQPTRQNILNAMQWLVRNAQPNDSLFFHYSGHGGQTKDLDGDEDDGFDEVIYPVDYKQAGHIVDDDMHEIMVRNLPAGCRLTAIFDCCHSGSALDLPWIYNHDGKVKEPNVAAEVGQGLLGAVTSYARHDMGGVFQAASGIFKTATGGQGRAQQRARQVKSSAADVISFSGCKDSQTSADTVEAGLATGAMSYAFIKSISTWPHQTYQQLLTSLRDILSAKYSQKPQLSSSHPMDTNLLFIA